MSISSINDKSSWQAEPPCKYFARCGGCNLQHLSAPEQYKFSLVEEGIKTLSSYGILHPIKNIPVNTRRRVQFKVSNKALSFNKLQSNETVKIDECLLLEDGINNLIEPINKLLQKMSIRVENIAITSSDTSIELLFYSNEKTNLALEELLALFAKQHNLGRIAWQIKQQSPYAIVQLRPFQLKFNDIQVDLPINAFLQVSKESSKIMLEIILKHLTKGKKILELYAGCGSFTIEAATKAPVLAVEGSEPAIKALEAAVRRHQLPIKTLKQDLYQVPVAADVISNYPQILINPPRNGATPQIKQIAKAEKIEKVIMVSCSLNNFIRDAKILLQADFKLAEIYPIDQFLYSEHVEIIGIFSK